MKQHLKDNWILYLYLIIQIPLVIMKYKEIIEYNWFYVLIPTMLMFIFIFITIVFGIYCGIKE